jgi:threonine dehydratase
MTTDYLKKILTARVYDVADETPLELAPTLSQRYENRIYFKREDMQSVFSFKIRGAYNKMAHLSDAQRKRGVICASAGNHAQGVALSAAKLGCRADRHADHHAAGEDRRRQGARRRTWKWCCTASPTPMPTTTR